jgi:hypothetical protein
LPIPDLAIKRPRDHELASPAVASGPSCPSSNEQRAGGGGGRNAQGNQSHSRAFLDVPRRFTLENRQLPLALPQSFGKLRKLHVSLNPLSVRLLRLATQKTRALVQNLWTM